MASEHTLQRFPVNAEDFGSPGEIVMVRFKYAYNNIVPFEILQRYPAATLSSA